MFLKVEPPIVFESSPEAFHSRSDPIYTHVAANAGLVAVPIMFRLIPNEYQNILEQSGATAFLIARDFVEGANSIRNKIHSDLAARFIYLGDDKTPGGYINYE